MTDDSPDYLSALLEAYWFAPPVALWRAVELRVAAQERLARPLLDLGCGDGLVAKALFGPGGVDLGIDPWAEQLRRAAASGMYDRIAQATGDRLPCPDGAFASVFSNSVLEHIPDVVPVVREAGRVLAPGGRFVFTVPSDAFHQLLYFYQRRLDGGDLAGAKRYAAQVDARLAHHHYHSPQEWAGLLRDGGMELETARYYIPRPVVQLWDRMNARFGIGARSWWSVAASPRLRGLGTQRLLRHRVVSSLSGRWRSYYEMDVPPGEQGGGLLIVGRRV